MHILNLIYYNNFEAEFVAVNNNGSTSVPEASNLWFIMGLGILFLVKINYLNRNSQLVK